MTHDEKTSLTLVCRHPSIVAPVSEWREHLAWVESLGDPERDIGLEAATDHAKTVIAVMEDEAKLSDMGITASTPDPAQGKKP